MQPATFFLALTLILLFTKPSLSSRAIVDDTLVYDAEGNPVQKHASYFISPPIQGPLGSPVMLLPGPRDENGTCEADVLQYQFPYGPATPFTFTQAALNEDVIKLGYPIAIQSTQSPCEGSSVWKVTNYTEVPANFITTGGIINTPSSCLRITKPHEPLFPNTYMFEYCPYLCGAGHRICQPIGNHMGHLSPNGDSFEFILIKTSQSAAMI